MSQTPTTVSLDRFYALGLVALMIQHLGVTFAALSLVRERGSGIAEMLRVAPVSIGERLAGKTVAFLLLGGLATAALTALVVWVFDVPLPAAWTAWLGLVALTLLASLGFGFLVAAVAATDSQAVQFSMLLLLAAIFFSGLFMPLDRIGMPAEVVAWLLPTTYAFTGFKDLMLMWQPPGWLVLAGPAALALVTFGLARGILAARATPA